MLLSSLKYFFDLGKSYQNTLVCYERIMEILTEPLQTNGEIEINTINDITVKDLAFAYGEDEQSVINAFSYTFTTGNIYCLSGENGAGKTTLLKILIGLYMYGANDRVMINGFKLADIDMIGLRRRQIGFTEQVPDCIAGTVGENLFLHSSENGNLSDESANVLSLFSFDRFIGELPNGFDTIINEDNSCFSGGEMQKLAILRQLIKNPDLMIFDEPTSALDYESKIEFINHLESIKENKIILLITHDEYIKRKCDDEIVLA